MGAGWRLVDAADSSGGAATLAVDGRAPARSLLQASVTLSLAQSQLANGTLNSTVAYAFMLQYATLWDNTFTVLDCAGSRNSKAWYFRCVTWEGVLASRTRQHTAITCKMADGKWHCSCSQLGHVDHRQLYHHELH